MTPIQFLKSRGGYYSTREIANAICVPECDVHAFLKEAHRRGTIERRAYAQQVAEYARGKRLLDPVDQWRVAA